MKKIKLLTIFEINTLKKRFHVIIGVGIMLSLALVIAVSYLSLKSIEKAKVETSLIADLKEMSDNIDSVYYALLQISQQMVSTGSIGYKYNRYLLADEQYDKIELYKEFSESINIAVFGNKNITLTSYFNPDSNKQGKDKIVFSNFMVNKLFNPLTLSTLLETDQVRFQSLHTSHNNVIEKDVLSLTRPVTFENGLTSMIYIEAYCDILKSIQHRSKLQNTEYIFLQLDTEKRIQFSSSPLYSIGQILNTNSNIKIQNQHHIGFSQQSNFGYSNVLLMPLIDYKKEMNTCFLSVGVIMLIALGVLFSISTLLNRLIYRPIKTLQKEMKNFSSGDFSIEDYSFSIQEFDILFQNFNKMKAEIQMLLNEIKNQEQLKSKLELEKLYYQINPHLKMRYDFTYIFDIEEGEYLDCQSARFILQPIAENAVCHNMDEFGHLWISVKKNHKIQITIKDDGKGFTVRDAFLSEKRESRKNNGIGLTYVQMSLEDFYKGHAEMNIKSKENEGTEVELLLPHEKG